jgi:hypothetical protein
VEVQRTLSTAAILWSSGATQDAVEWVRRAVEQCAELDYDARALELAKAAADLAVASEYQTTNAVSGVPAPPQASPVLPSLRSAQPPTIPPLPPPLPPRTQGLGPRTSANVASAAPPVPRSNVSPLHRSASGASLPPPLPAGTASVPGGSQFWSAARGFVRRDGRGLVLQLAQDGEASPEGWLEVIIVPLSPRGDLAGLVDRNTQTRPPGRHLP